MKNPSSFEILVVLLCRSLERLESPRQIRHLFISLQTQLKMDLQFFSNKENAKTVLRPAMKALALCLHNFLMTQRSGGHRWSDILLAATQAGAASCELLAIWRQCAEQSGHMASYWAGRQPLIAASLDAAKAWTEAGIYYCIFEIKTREDFHRMSKRVQAIEDLTEVAAALGRDKQEAYLTWVKILSKGKQPPSPALNVLKGKASYQQLVAAAVTAEATAWRLYADSQDA